MTGIPMGDYALVPRDTHELLLEMHKAARDVARWPCMGAQMPHYPDFDAALDRLRKALAAF